MCLDIDDAEIATGDVGGACGCYHKIVREEWDNAFCHKVAEGTRFENMKSLPAIAEIDGIVRNGDMEGNARGFKESPRPRRCSILRIGLVKNEQTAFVI